MKMSEGFTRPLISFVTIALIVISFFVLSKSMQVVPVGTAYAVFTGGGAVGTAIIGMTFLNEETSIIRVIFIGILITGIIGLKFVSGDSKKAQSEERAT
ncbi:QacE family quaternary ammonium compound efflux SMR transporter [Bacillaceae bacterium SIJ1]|nr:SMR family transporter [Litoribacterium kuwaitense]NGP46684.1 QacE family quaternary ammonium compound efflux SMR transporter [Litoribacterium kuwaitense]